MKKLLLLISIFAIETALYSTSSENGWCVVDSNCDTGLKCKMFGCVKK